MEDRLPLVQAKEDQRPHQGNTRTRRFPWVPEQYPAQTDDACKEREKSITKLVRTVDQEQIHNNKKVRN
jgi:hypothetical protein